MRHSAMHFGRARLHRFDDPECEYEVLYMARDFHGAFIETFGRQLDVRTVTTSALSRRLITTMRVERALRLIDLASSGGLARLSADSRLASGSFGVSQAWSRALWAHPVGADGIYYRLRHDAARFGCALFDRAGAVMVVAGQSTVLDPAHRSVLGDVLDAYGFSLIADV